MRQHRFFQVGWNFVDSWQILMLGSVEIDVWQTMSQKRGWVMSGREPMMMTRINEARGIVELIVNLDVELIVKLIVNLIVGRDQKWTSDAVEKYVPGGKMLPDRWLGRNISSMMILDSTIHVDSMMIIIDDVGSIEMQRERTRDEFDGMKVLRIG
jgi:hypothetical protein